MPSWFRTYRNHLHLHFIILIFGFTGILGKLISVPSAAMVWYRMLIAVIGLVIYLLIIRHRIRISRKSVLRLLLLGVVIATHWALFFEALKVSNVSVTLACLSATALFTALLEPLFFKRKIIGYEVLFGFLILLGLYLIFRFETQYVLGIVYSLLSAFFAALFTVLNGVLVKSTDSRDITLFEMMGGVLAITIYLAVTGDLTLEAMAFTTTDLIYLLLLGLVATAYAFLISVEVMKELSPFTVSISVNLEPIYAILLALAIFGETEFMSGGFYLGAGLILLTVIANGVLKSRARKSEKLPNQSP